MSTDTAHEMIRGVKIYRHLPEELATLYESAEWMDWLHEGELSSLCIDYRNKVIGSIRFEQLFSSLTKTHWSNIAARLTEIPNGQVKNFLVACRTYSGGQGTVRICVRGSKASQGGGLWHRFYALFLLMSDVDVTIDFFDYSEIDDGDEIEVGAKKATLNWFAKAYPGQGEGYDVVIDDAWTGGVGVKPFECVSKYFSYKGVGQNYLHFTEKRYFSVPSRTTVTVNCPCVLCNEIARCSSSYDIYVWLRMMCVVLGHNSLCLTFPSQSDLVHKGSVLRLLMTQPYYKVKSSVDSRAILSLMEEIPIAVRGPDEVSYDVIFGERKRQRFVHGRGFLDPVKSKFENTTSFNGKSVRFIGVQPSILGDVQIHRSPEGGYYDFVFSSTPEAFAQQLIPARFLYTQGSIEYVQSVLGWRATGRQFLTFNEYAAVAVQSTVKPHTLVFYHKVYEKKGLQQSETRDVKYFYTFAPIVQLFPRLDNYIGIPLRWSVRDYGGKLAYAGYQLETGSFALMKHQVRPPEGKFYYIRYSEESGTMGLATVENTPLPFWVGYNSERGTVALNGQRIPEDFLVGQPLDISTCSYVVKCVYSVDGFVKHNCPLEFVFDSDTGVWYDFVIRFWDYLKKFMNGCRRCKIRPANAGASSVFSTLCRFAPGLLFDETNIDYYQ